MRNFDNSLRKFEKHVETLENWNMRKLQKMWEIENLRNCDQHLENLINLEKIEKPWRWRKLFFWKTLRMFETSWEQMNHLKHLRNVWRFEEFSRNLENKFKLKSLSHIFSKIRNTDQRFLIIKKSQNSQTSQNSPNSQDS